MGSAEKRLSILVLTFASVNSGPRPLKQVRALQERYDITTAGVGPAPRGVDDHIELQMGEGSNVAWRLLFTAVLALRLHRIAFWASSRNRDAWLKLRDREWDIIINHDVATMTLALRLRARIGRLTDLHEYAPRQNDQDWKWRMTVAPYFRWICKHEVPKTDAITTVGVGIADEYRRNYGFNASVVVNATPFQDLRPTALDGPIKLVHSGAPSPTRRIHVMIEAVRDTKADVTFDLYLLEDGSAYYQQLVDLAATTERVCIKEPVPYDQLVRTLNGYDVGLAVIAPLNFNQAWCLPNKFFDFIQARLGVVVGPSPEMVRFVDDYGIGAVAAGFDSADVARVLDGLTSEVVTEWKHRSAEHAEALSGERQVGVWVTLVDELAARGANPRDQAGTSRL